MRLLRYSLLAIMMLALSATALAQYIQAPYAPPALPVYEQPPCPDEGYIWTPGYWAYDQDYEDYYWVPGTWVEAPEPGYFWTPPYWSWENDAYYFHQGYWGPQVGWYGGIPYGYGYYGEGYEGGRWQDGHFYYNREANDVRNNRYVYDNPVHRDRDDYRVSYNGGEGGITARPSSRDEEAERERHVPPVAAQAEHVQQAHSDPRLRAADNHGKPPIAATPKPTDFRGSGVVQAKQAGAPYQPPANRKVGPRGNQPAPGNQSGRGNESMQANQPAHPENNGRPAVHPKDLPPLQPPAPRNTGNPKADQKYQQQQETQYVKQQQDRQKLQQKQDQEHQKLEQRNPGQARQQQVEQKHQQQTQKLEQRQQRQEQKSAPPRPVAHPEPPPGAPPH